MLSLLFAIWYFFFPKKKKQVAASIPPTPAVATEITEEEKKAIQIKNRNNLFVEKFENETFDEYKRRRKAAKEFANPKKRRVPVFHSQDAILDKIGKVKGYSQGKTFKGDASTLKPI